MAAIPPVPTEAAVRMMGRRCHACGSTAFYMRDEKPADAVHANAAKGFKLSATPPWLQCGGCAAWFDV
jgi:hypothetical protein